MLPLILSTMAHADVVITHSVPTHHIAGEKFYIDLQLFNDGPQTEKVPDIGKQRWQVEFQIQTSTGTQHIHSSKPDDASPATVSIASRGLKEFRFEVPNSAAWTTGTIQFAIQTPLNEVPFEQTIIVHPKTFDGVDAVGLENALFTPLDTILWTTPEHHLFKGFELPHYIASIGNDAQFGTSAHLGLHHHLYWLQGQSLTIVPAARDRLEPPLQAAIPWPANTVHLIGQAITDANGRFLLPLWIAGKDVGTLYLLRATPQGAVSFRKLYTGSKPTQYTTGISQAGTPLIALSTDREAWLLSVTETGNPQVDSLPPKSTRILQTSKDTTIENLQFAVSDANGLFLSALTKKSLETKSDSPKQWTYSIHAHSLQGSVLTQPVRLETSESFSHMTHLENTPYFINAKGAWDSTGSLVFTSQRRSQGGDSFWRNENGSLYQYEYTKQRLHRNQAKKNLGGKGE